MKRAEILATLAADPQAEFAFRPSTHDLGVCKVRGLEPRSNDGASWTFAAYKRESSETWSPAVLGESVRSHEIVTVTEAEAIFVDRRAQRRGAVDNLRQIEQVVFKLVSLGVPARATNGRFEILDMTAFEIFLDGIAAMQERAEHRRPTRE